MPVAWAVGDCPMTRTIATIIAIALASPALAQPLPQPHPKTGQCSCSCFQSVPKIENYGAVPLAS